VSEFPKDRARGFRPAFHFKNVLDIPASLFAEHGIKGVVLDVDNTITRWELTSVPDEIMAWMDALKERGFKLAFLSNGLSAKLKEVEAQTGIRIVPGKKPFLSSFARARDLLECVDAEIAMVGDQCVTDIWPANRMGWLSILVEPISTSDFLGTQFYRWLERIFGMRTPAR